MSNVIFVGADLCVGPLFVCSARVYAKVRKLTPLRLTVGAGYMYVRPLRISLFCLRIHAFQHTRIRDRLANVRQTANPRNGTLHAQPETGMRYAAKPPQIKIPRIILAGDPNLRDPLLD